MLVRRLCEEQPERSLISLSGWTSSRRSGGSRAVSALEPRAAEPMRPARLWTAPPRLYIQATAGGHGRHPQRHPLGRDWGVESGRIDASDALA